MAASVIVVSSQFDGTWPFAADHFHALWKKEGDVDFVRLSPTDERPLGDIVSQPSGIRRLVVLGVRLTELCLSRMNSLREVAFVGENVSVRNACAARHIRVYQHTSEGFWGESVAEFALALTLCVLRRIPQLHDEIIRDQKPWNYSPPNGVGTPGARGGQYGDDSRFTNGTLSGKRVRIVGAGNIGSRMASWAHVMGADVAVWDPKASDPCFHRAAARREYHLDRLVRDAEIFLPMLPLTDATRGIVKAEHINALPKGCLVVMVTRAAICDMPTVRRRVLADEIALAADVFDVEPLGLDDPLLGRHNVIHTPHNAGRTQQANEQWAEMLAAQFSPVQH